MMTPSLSWSLFTDRYVTGTHEGLSFDAMWHEGRHQWIVLYDDKVLARGLKNRDEALSVL